MCSNRRIHFAYFLVFSLLMHMLLLAVPLSLKVDNKKEIMEVFYFAGGGAGEGPGRNNLQQKETVKKEPGAISHERRASISPSSPSLSNDLRNRKNRKTTMVVDNVPRQPARREEIADDNAVAVDKTEQVAPVIDHSTSPSSEGALGYNRAGGEGAFSAGSGTGEGMSAAGLEGSGGDLDAEFGATDGPQFLHRELPEYPFVSKKRGEEGTALLRLQIDDKGNLVKADVINATNAAFAQAALSAMKKSTFKPAHKNGQPVPVRAILPVRFRLDQ